MGAGCHNQRGLPSSTSHSRVCESLEDEMTELVVLRGTKDSDWHVGMKEAKGGLYGWDSCLEFCEPSKVFLR